MLEPHKCFMGQFLFRYCTMIHVTSFKVVKFLSYCTAVVAAWPTYMYHTNVHSIAALFGPKINPDRLTEWL